MTFALTYFLCPIDMIPDFIPLMGYTDDISFFAMTMKLIGCDIERYKVWKEQQLLPEESAVETVVEEKNN